MYIKGMAPRDNDPRNTNTSYRHTNSKEIKERGARRKVGSGQQRKVTALDIEIEERANRISDGYRGGAAKLPINTQQPREIARFVFAAAEKLGMSISEYVARTMVRESCKALGAEEPSLDAYDAQAAQQQSKALATTLNISLGTARELLSAGRTPREIEELFRPKR